MAKIDWKSPIEAIHGKLFKGFGAAKRSTKNAKGDQPNFSVFYGKRTTEVTADELANRNHFAAVIAKYNERRGNPTKRTQDQAAFAAQSTYTTLRSYIWHVCEVELAAATA